MKRKVIFMIPAAIVLVIMMGIIGKNIDKNRVLDKDSQSQGIDSQIQDMDTEIQPTESGTENTERSLVEGMVSDWEEKSWDEIAALYSNYKDVYKIEQEFNSQDTDLQKWFQNYNGEEFQIIPSKEKENATVRRRREIVFYRTDETDIQKVLNTMLTRLIDTLMEDSNGRPYTITKYELDNLQPLKEINENVWILNGIEGYYSYEGTDMGTMEQVMPYETDIKDGMLRFLAQGSSSTHQYILIRNDGVYRLELAEEMGFGIEY